MIVRCCRARHARTGASRSQARMPDRSVELWRRARMYPHRLLGASRSNWSATPAHPRRACTADPRPAAAVRKA